MPRLREDLTHPWRVTPEEAEETQRRLAPLVRLAPLAASGPGAPVLAAGADVAYSRDGTRAWAAAVVMDAWMRVVDAAVVAGEPDAPYRPGLLAFREGRLTVEALLALTSEPGVLFLDGHGVVHERGCGLASHVGLLFGLPSVGVPKTPFHAIEASPPPGRGSRIVLTKEWGAEGAALRLKHSSRPVYVSPGNLVDLESAVALCLAWSSGRHRVPDPLSAAHTLSVVSRSAG
ncbi:MAG: endonuclease V [Coriobacteriia bacterium]|nr:endonuclease V [Coriobacteriia bacterium]